MDKIENIKPNFFRVNPIGHIRKNDDQVTVEILEYYQDALLGLEGFSHIIVFSWFHENDIPEKTTRPVIKQFKASFNKAEVEFIHIKATNIGVCPPRHPGAGGKSWLFCDEIIIQ